MISFQVHLSTGQKYEITDNPSTTLLSAINKLFSKEKIRVQIKTILLEGKTIFLNKTLSENNIQNNSIITLIVEKLFEIEVKDVTNCDINNPQQELEKCFYFLINVVKVPQYKLDDLGNSLGDWGLGRKSGPDGYLKEYYPPLGWIGIGLKVLDIYDKGDNRWLGNENKEGEWYIAYHGIKSIESINSILFKGFRKGAFQEYRDYKNMNPLSDYFYKYCDEGVYFIPNFTEAEKYVPTFEYMGDKYKIIFMCRVNPHKVRIAKIENNLESWIVNGNDYNYNGSKQSDEVRICRILMKIDK